MTAVWHPRVVAQFAAGSVAAGEFLTVAEANKEAVLITALAFAVWQPRDRLEMARLHLLLEEMPHVFVVPVTLNKDVAVGMIEEPFRWAGATLPEVHAVRIVFGLPEAAAFILPSYELDAHSDLVVAPHLPPTTYVHRLEEPPHD